MTTALAARWVRLLVVPTVALAACSISAWSVYELATRGASEQGAYSVTLDETDELPFSIELQSGIAEPVQCLSRDASAASSADHVRAFEQAPFCEMRSVRYERLPRANSAA